MTGSRRRARAAAVASAVVLSGLAVGAGGSAALADDAVPPFWYAEDYGISDGLEPGATGAGITVAVLDSQMNPDIPTLQGVDLEVPDDQLGCHDGAGNPAPAVSTDPVLAAHGTNSVSLVAGTGAGFPGQTGVKGAAPDAKVLFYSLGADDGWRDVVCDDANGTPIPKSGAILAAIDAGADIISIQVDSAGTIAGDPAIIEALQKGVIVLIALPNGEDVFKFEPGAGPGADNANGVIGVAAIDAYGQLPAEQAAGNPVTDIVGPGIDMGAQGGPGATSWEQQTVQSGTSNATPFIAGILAATWSKYPDATGNQMIQSLLRNTGVEDHEFARQDDLVGYGVASLRHMLREDPTQYPDVNPLIIDDRDFNGDDQRWLSPRYQEIFPDSVPSTTEDGHTSTGPTGVLPFVIGAAIVLGVLVLAGIITLIIVLAVRARRRAPGQA